MKKRFMNIVLALVLVVGFCVPAFAADGDDALESKRKELEGKYGIGIRYDNNSDGSAAIGTGSLATLDSALSKLTPTVVKQVSQYYQDKLGKKLTYSFAYSPYHDLDSNVEILASFNRETALIELYIPSSSKGTFTTGCSPITILHEFGHAFYFMYTDKYGESKMEEDWVKLNNGVKYNEGYIAYAYNKVTFMSGYGASSLGEDFAELFSHAFIRDRAGLGMSHRLFNEDRKTALGEKLTYIENMIPKYLTDTSACVANLQKAYTAAVAIEYQGIRLMGEYMEFMGCNQPRYVLNGILGELGYSAEESDWITDIGGWHVKTTTGKYLLVFPGGTNKSLSGPLKLAA